MFAGSNENVWPSDGLLGSISTAAVDPVAEKTPRNGAAMPPKASHGEPAWSAVATASLPRRVTGVAPLPPSMNDETSEVLGARACR